MKVWMWQRLYKIRGRDKPVALLECTEKSRIMNRTHEWMMERGMHWLCPKANLVLVSRKHLENHQ